MTSRLVCSSLVLALSLAATPVFAQTAAAPASTNPAPETPAAPAPAPTPAPAAADTTATPSASTTERPTSYTMVAGDSLDSIAKKFDTSIRALAKLNNIKHSQYRKLRTGTVLKIPPANSTSK